MRMYKKNYGYITLEECIELGEHLISVDEDDFCNSCGHQDEDVPFFNGIWVDCDESDLGI